MDSTALLVFFFGLLKLGLWIGFAIGAIWLGRKLWKETQPIEDDAGATGLSWSEVLWLNKGWLTGAGMAFIALVMFTQQEMAYRPKTVIEPNNVRLEERMREVDRAAAPVIEPAEADKRDTANTGYSERNAKENEAARDRFLKLPDNTK